MTFKRSQARVPPHLPDGPAEAVPLHFLATLTAWTGISINPNSENHFQCNDNVMYREIKAFPDF